jgi:PAS domain S-box-containing protein
MEMMKRTIFHQISLIRLLIASYVLLLIFVVFFRYQEYHQTQHARAYINTISQRSTQKLELLIGMNKAVGYVQVALLRHVYASDRDHVTRQHEIINVQRTNYKSNFLAYGKLKKTKEEQRIFDALRRFKNDNDRARDTLLYLSNKMLTVSDLRMQVSIFKQQNTYEKFQEANARLSSLITKQAENEIANINTYIFQISKRREISSYVVIFLLCVLALAIGNAIRKINETNSALAQSKNKYRQFVEHTGEIIIRSDSHKRILFANKSFKEKMKYNDEEISRLHISDILCVESKLNYNSEPNFSKCGERVTNMNVIFKTKEGDKIYLEGNMVLNYKDGALETAETFLRDITIRKRLVDELSASENKYRALFDLSPLPKYFIDMNTMEFIEVNAAALKKYGYPREEFLKMSIYDLRTPGKEEREQFDNWITPFKKLGSSFETRTVHYKKSGQQIEIELRFKAIELMGRQLFLVVAIDVTKKEKREREMNQAILKAQENERREIGTELHDNICQILASSHLLLDSAKRMEKAESTDLIDKSKKHIMQALTEIRNLSHHMAPIFFEAGSFEEAIKELLQNMNPDNKSAVGFTFDPKIVLKMVSRDIQLNLYRILQEQLKNIVKYAKATNIQVELCLQNDMIRMQIMDNGVGFDKDKVKKGIGFINMQRRAESFSGKFSFETSLGKGCTVFIELPVWVNDLNGQFFRTGSRNCQ